MERTGGRLDFDFSDVVAVTQGTNTVVQCTITNHLATPTDLTIGTDSDWVIRVLPEQNKQILSHAPKASIPAIALVNATQAQAEQGTSPDANATAQSIGQYVRHASGEQSWDGFRLSTAASPVQMAVGTWQTTASASTPFVRTLRYRPHSATEAAAILREAVPGSFVQQMQTAAIFNQYRVAVITPVTVPNSDVPVIQMLAVFEFTHGTFAANTDSTLTVVGAIASLGVKSSDFKNTKGNPRVTMDTTFRNFPRRAGPDNGQPAPEFTEDWQMEVYVPSRTSVINTNMAGVTGWNVSGAKAGHARVQWSTDGGSTWTSSPVFTDVYNSNITANLPVAAGYQIRPGAVGRVLVRWQVQRSSGSANWWFDRSQAFASVN